MRQTGLVALAMALLRAVVVRRPECRAVPVHHVADHLRAAAECGLVKHRIRRPNDFEAFYPLEKINLASVSNITDFADLQANHLSQDNADALITDGSGTIRQVNVLTGDLDAGDFFILTFSMAPHTLEQTA